MICQCCGAETLESIDGNYYAGINVRYIYHPGFGGQVMICATCGFMAVEFVHPDTLRTYYGLQAARDDGGLDPARRQLDAIVTRGQSEQWLTVLDDGTRNILFYSAGRGAHAGVYAAGDRSVHVRELFPGLRDGSFGDARVDILSDDAAAAPHAGSYDAVVLSNAFERLPFPAHWLAWCSHMLTPGGLLFAEFPKMDPGLVRAMTYLPEEVNFFTPDCLGGLIARQGSFAVAHSSLGNNPDGRQTIRVILRNQRRTAELPVFTIEPNAMLGTLGRLNFGCFNVARYVAPTEAMVRHDAVEVPS